MHFSDLPLGFLKGVFWLRHKWIFSDYKETLNPWVYGWTATGNDFPFPDGFIRIFLRGMERWNYSLSQVKKQRLEQSLKINMFVLKVFFSLFPTLVIISWTQIYLATPKLGTTGLNTSSYYKNFAWIKPKLAKRYVVVTMTTVTRWWQRRLWKKPKNKSEVTGGSQRG